MFHTVSCDLTVVGAGFAGICTAIAAARQGLQVALVNDRDVAGGNASSEHRVSIGGAASGNQSHYAREAGIADELKLFLVNANPKHVAKQDFHLTDMAFYQAILNEPNIRYFPGTCVYDCACEDGKITKAMGFKAKTQQTVCFESPLFCDASGDGILGVKAGAEYRVGREAAAEFGESLAPEQADSCVMGSCILFTTRQEEGIAPFCKPSFTYDFVKDNILRYFDRPETEREMPPNGGPYNGTWWIEYGGMNDTVAEADEIDFELKRLIYGYWDYIKNSGKYPETANTAIDWIAPYASKRESRRFVGEYMLTQNDIQQCREFDDAVSIGGWVLDIHDVGGIYGNERTSAYGPVHSIYNIPLSIMYSKTVPNLFLAGRLVSCTHVAMGSTRVMETLGAMGQAVGTAAALCIKYACLPTDVRHTHIQELQSLLQKNGQFIIGRKEDGGLAHSATIRTSSERVFENTEVTVEWPLSQPIFQTFPLKNGSLTTVDVYVKNRAATEVQLAYAVYGEDRRRNYRKGRLLASGTVNVPAQYDGYVTIAPNVTVEDHKVFLELTPHNELSVMCSENRITGAPTFGENGRYLQENGKARVLCFKNVEGSAGMYAADNLVNGYSRPYGGPNCWISDGKDNQWVELAFDRPQTVQEIALYGNPQFETDQFTAPIEQLLRDADITVETEDGTQIYELRDNYFGQPRIAVKARGVRKIRIDLLANNGAPNFELFAVKVF